MRKQTFKCYSQRQPHKTVGQGDFPASLAEPGQSLTPQEILRNFTLTGRTGLDSFVGDVDEEGVVDDVAMMDKIEREDVRRGVSARSKEYLEAIERANKAKPVEDDPKPVEDDPKIAPSA